MNINVVIDYLNKNYGYEIGSGYYAKIAEWRDWWKGFFKPFHRFEERGANNQVIERELYTLKMAKKVSED